MATNSTSLPICSFKGDQDIYGLGIRTGIYLQWFAAYLTFQFLPSGITELLDATAIFELALFIAAMVLTGSSTTRALELHILVLLLFADFWVVQVPAVLIALSSSQNPHPSCIGLTIRAVFPLAVSAFSFWVNKIAFEKFQQEGCDHFVLFFYRQVMPDQKDRFILWLVNVGSFIASLIFFGQALWLLVLIRGEVKSDDILGQRHGFLVGVKTWMVPMKESIYRVLEEGSEETKRRFRWLIRLVAPLLAAFAITNIEYTIHKNKIKEVDSYNSTGQLIPLVIGLGTVWKVVAQLISNSLPDPEQAKPDALPVPTETKGVRSAAQEVV